jgi:hypothetical protein
MALVVEDGTGKADAESLISVADATSYHAARGNTAWADLASDTVREQMLRRATDYMQATYKQRWKGVPVTTTQALDWPRAYVEREYSYSTATTPPSSIDGNLWWPSNEVPVAVQRACAELALRAIDGDLAPDLDAPVIREKVGPIETEYAVGARQSTVFRAIEGMLAPFFAASGGMLKVTRA